MKRALFWLGLALAATTHAQPPDSLWSRTYGGSGGDWALSVQQTADEGFIVAGYTHSFGATWSDAYLVKTDADGDTLWTRMFGTNGYEAAGCVQQTTDGGYVLAGVQELFGSQNQNAYLVKTNAAGDSMWTRSFGGGGNQWASAVQQTSDGGYVLTGTTLPSGSNIGDIYLVKTDASGNTIWTRSLGGAGDDRAYAIQQTEDGGYILAGESSSFGDATQMFLVKTDAAGDTLWTRRFGGVSNDRALTLQQTDDGGYILAGATFSFGNGDADLYAVKTDASGDSLWTRVIGGIHFDDAESVRQTSDNDYVLAGWTRSFGTGPNDMYLVKLDASGDSLWTRTFGGGIEDRAYCVHLTDDGGFVLAGATNSLGSGDWDMYLLKTAADVPPPPLRVASPNGGEQWPLFSTQTVTWVSDTVSGMIRIELNRQYPNGQWEIVADNTPDDNQEQVTVTGSFSNTCRVRISLIGDTISDVSNGNFSIINPLRITSPNGNEVWPLFSTQTVTWVSDNVNGLMRLEINRDYPTGTWEALADNTSDDNTEAVFVGMPTSGNCRIRISLIGDTLSDVSNGNFQITTSAGVLRMVRPAQPNTPVNFWYAGVLEAPDTVSESFRLKNFGSEAIAVMPPAEPASAEFSLTTICDTLVLAPNQMSTCNATLFFHPQENGQHDDTLRILTNASNGDAQNNFRVPLEGELILAAEVSDALPKSFAMHPAYPNPFNPSTEIRYDLPKAGHVILRVVDMLGREVAVLVNETEGAGSYRVNFDGSQLPSGSYFAKLGAGPAILTQKLLLVK